MGNTIGESDSSVGDGALDPLVREHWNPETESVSATVVRAVAAAEGGTELELDEPLYDAVDPDALDQLFAPKPDGTSRLFGQLHFRYHGYSVLVHGFGRIDVFPSEVDLTSVVDAPALNR